ncbi:MAG: protein phosphatase 2C domain-containing protein [Aureispira sp.]
MRIYQHLALGAFHPVFCEDFCVNYELGDNWIVLAVLDGCSAGTDSHFAATLLGKIISKVSRQAPYWGMQDRKLELSRTNSKILGTHFVKAVFKELCFVKQQLFLSVEELLSTCLLALYHQKQKDAWINSSGDGVFVINDECYVLDQDDKPNYMVYHCNKSPNQWLEEQTISYHFETVHNLALSTDGILSFEENFKINPLDYLLKDTRDTQYSTMLQKKCRILGLDYHLQPNDDLGIIRLWNP